MYYTMGKIYLIMPYFGNFPTYFQLYLDSLSINNSILTVLILSDIPIDSYKLPENAKVVFMTLDEVKTRAVSFIKEEYNKVVDRKDILNNNYKLCDFRPVYFSIFADHLSCLNLSCDDYVGWGDCDVIYGNISSFLKLGDQQYSFIGIHGHFTAFRYTQQLTNLYKKIENLDEHLLDPVHLSIDEVHLRKIILNMIKCDKYVEFPVRDYFCDVLPGRKMVASSAKNKIIDHLIFDIGDKKLLCYDGDNTYKEVLYAHLQKRKMNVNFENYNIRFIIKESSFELIP
jgi:hypothetical protein